MSKAFSVFVVDDDKIIRTALAAGLGKSFDVEAFSSAKECLARLDERVPDAALLDVEMPDIDGYELCEQIKSLSSCADVRVIFVSAQDDIDSRLRGFEVGGYDFVTKPFNLVELTHKLELAEEVAAGRKALEVRSSESELLASMVMGTLDEYAVLVRFLRTLNVCEDQEAVGRGVMEMLQAFHLEGAIQFRIAGSEVTFNANGLATPLEAAIFGQVRSMGRVVQFRNRAAYNFDNVSLLVNNMPLHDADLCGRLRDHLAIAIESADARISAIVTRRQASHTQAHIGELIDSLRRMLEAYKENYVKARFRGTMVGEEMIQMLSGQFAGLSLSDIQEDRISQTLREGLDEIATAYDLGGQMENTLHELGERLQKLLS